MVGDLVEDHRDGDQRKSVLDFPMGCLKSAVLREESDSAPAVESELASDELAPDREERKSPSHVWAHLYRRVMQEVDLRQLIPVQKNEAGSYSMMKKQPGPQAHLLVDRGFEQA